MLRSTKWLRRARLDHSDFTLRAQQEKCRTSERTFTAAQRGKRSFMQSAALIGARIYRCGQTGIRCDCADDCIQKIDF
jgi:hypothetical protein